MILENLENKINKLMKNEKDLLDEVNQLTYESSELQKNLQIINPHQIFIQDIIMRNVLPL